MHRMIWPELNYAEDGTQAEWWKTPHPVSNSEKPGSDPEPIEEDLALESEERFEAKLHK